MIPMPGECDPYERLLAGIVQTSCVDELGAVGGPAFSVVPGPSNSTSQSPHVRVIGAARLGD